MAGGGGQNRTVALTGSRVIRPPLRVTPGRVVTASSSPWSVELIRPVRAGKNEAFIIVAARRAFSPAFSTTCKKLGKVVGEMSE